MAEAFLDEALARLIKYGVVASVDGKLRFTDEWIEYLTSRLNYTMGREELKNRIVGSLIEFYGKKGYRGEVRFDLAWVKQIFMAQLGGLGEDELSLIAEFAEAVKLLDS